MGVTAIILIYFEGIIIYSKFNNSKKKKILLLLIVVCIFLTGKRSISLLAILLPVIGLLLNNRVTSKRIFNVLAVVSILGVLVYFLAMNAELFIDQRYLVDLQAQLLIWKMVKIFQVIEAYYIQRQFNYLIIISYGNRIRSV